MRARGEFRPERSMAVLVQWIASSHAFSHWAPGHTAALPRCTD